ncbi:cbb3-type cytochrome oxidase assembly protein CcoS [Hydrogenophilus thermoluteolus]|jgi:cbb3-type cytochrome oxidase maturation protein|nr:cbb3-type cytochrome oxidase assembly protein CcoS [Hydrogenophilus thermoluteolus]HCO78117.1 cbb3-type cytochrome oxidase assembly protein CcoS [Rhodocyclaceae bacterium]
MHCAYSGFRSIRNKGCEVELEILYLLIPLSLVLVVVIGGVFWWAVKRGQFDDLEGPAYQILFDEEPTKPESRPDAAARDAKK